MSRYLAMAGTRLGELASSSPSRMTRTFDDGGKPRRLQRVERGAQRDDRRLVVRRRPRVDPPVGVERVARRRGIHFGPSSIDPAGPQHGLERIRLLPRLRLYRLPVVVRVEQQRPRRARNASSPYTSGLPVVSSSSARAAAGREHPSQVARRSAGCSARSAATFGMESSSSSSRTISLLMRLHPAPRRQHVDRSPAGPDPPTATTAARIHFVLSCISKLVFGLVVFRLKPEAT